MGFSVETDIARLAGSKGDCSPVIAHRLLQKKKIFWKGDEKSNVR